MMGAVGLVGIGLMGSALASRMLGAGIDVVGFDIDPVRRQALADLGGRAVQVLRDVSGCKVVVLALLNTGQVEAVVEEDDGLIASAPDDGTRRIAICTSTCEPARIVALASRMEAKGWSLVDAPVSGSSGQVAKGEGLGLISGQPEAIAVAQPVLDAIYPKRKELGTAGNSTKAKLVVNLILGLNRAALAEGLAFAEALGLEPARMLDVAQNSAAHSQIMDVKGDKMLSGDVTAQGKIAQQLKDVRIMLKAANEIGGELPLVSTLAALLQSAVESGEGEFDNSAVICEMRRRLSCTAMQNEQDC